MDIGHVFLSCVTLPALGNNPRVKDKRHCGMFHLGREGSSFFFSRGLQQDKLRFETQASLFVIRKGKRYTKEIAYQIQIVSRCLAARDGCQGYGNVCASVCWSVGLAAFGLWAVFIYLIFIYAHVQVVWSVGCTSLLKSKV
jgi:hypothetical protein